MSPAKAAPRIEHTESLPVKGIAVQAGAAALALQEKFIADAAYLTSGASF